MKENYRITETMFRKYCLFAKKRARNEKPGDPPIIVIDSYLASVLTLMPGDEAFITGYLMAKSDLREGLKKAPVISFRSPSDKPPKITS